ncbi:unnamed protein product [Callosobruchus maculatus]|uniref:Uncharacterized protein n=1 Tax=Callosobruchus maculatus TaxID=64391 RepID=A0A653DWW6_CALMS|nr:unnamed protein product [Callosobruchus maculatus]
MIVTTTLTTHSLAVSQKMEIHRLMNKFHRLKEKTRLTKKNSAKSKETMK